MSQVRAKKQLGQHFLKDQNIAAKIAGSLGDEVPAPVLEIGPGMGILTRFLLQNPKFDVHVVEIDPESVDYLNQHFPELKGKIIQGDFLKLNLKQQFSGSFSIIGNFPYNISSQILFKMIDNREQIPELVGMFQKEVAERVAAPPGSKTYYLLCTNRCLTRHRK